eukprot:12671242-Alexandrium_andersonii.AAC.1
MSRQGRGKTHLHALHASASFSGGPKAPCRMSRHAKKVFIHLCDPPLRQDCSVGTSRHPARACLSTANRCEHHMGPKRASLGASRRTWTEPLRGQPSP